MRFSLHLVSLVFFVSFFLTACRLSYMKLEVDSFEEMAECIECDSCKSYYTPRSKMYDTALSFDESYEAWRAKGYTVVPMKRLLKNGKWSTYEIHVSNFSHPEVPYPIGFIKFTKGGFKFRKIQLHGICISEETAIEIPYEERVRINSIIEDEFLKDYLQ